MSRPTRRRVALAFPATVPHFARTIKGIVEYARGHGRWVFVGSPEHDSRTMSVEELRGWDGDGVIALVNTRQEARVAQRLGMPVVNLSGALEHAGLPRVRSDYEACGRLAAEHLLERGFRRFAYFGLCGIWYAQCFGRGFISRLEQDGRPCAVLEVPSNIGSRRPWYQGSKELEDWLKKLRPPVGLLACHDPRARMVAEACERLGLRVPHDVAIVGINNDELTCEFCSPPLTSIARHGERIGVEAAAMLDRLMEGKPLPVMDVLIPPEGVVPRASTAVDVIEDPVVAAAVHYIREHAGTPIDVHDIVEVVPRSRRWLEQRFRDCLGVSPYEYLCRVRVQRAQTLLTDPRKPLLKEVALRCGFREVRRLRITFQRCLGLTPAASRRQHAPTGLPAPGKSR